MKIKITSPAQLIDFLKKYDLSFQKKIEVIERYYNHRFFKITFGDAKSNPIELVKRCEKHLRNGWPLPLAFYQEGKEFSIKDFINK